MIIMPSAVRSYKAYIIHLARSQPRKENIDRLKSRIVFPTQVVRAVDNRWLLPEDIERHVGRKLYRPSYPFTVNRNEVACFLSHRKVWTAIIEDGVDAGLVVEDDASITDDFGKSLDLACSFIRDGYIIRFPHRDHRELGPVVVQEGRHQLIEPKVVGLGAVAQLISRGAARRLLRLTDQFDRPVDTFLQMKWVTGVRSFSMQPSGIREISDELGGSTLKHDKTILGKLSREILRPIYRGQVRVYSARTPDPMPS